MTACGLYRVYRLWLESGNLRLRDANFCNQRRLCGCCGRVHAMHQSSNYAARTLRLLHEAEGVVFPVMLTLTQPAGPDVGERYEHLRTCLQKLRQLRYNARRRGQYAEWAKPEAIAWHIEIKRTRDGLNWHVHAHGVGLIRRFLDLDRTEAEWNAISGGKHRPDVRLLNSSRSLMRDGRRCYEDADFVLQLRHDLLEVFKYPVKFDELTPAETVEVWRAIKGRRMLFGWDGFYGMKQVNDLRDMTEEGGHWIDWYHKWVDGTYAVTQTHSGCNGKTLSVEFER